MVKDLLEMSLKKGITIQAIITATIIENSAINVDSVRNCWIRVLFSVPSTFRMPTSFARFAERAVDKFMKLIQAINKIKIAATEKMYTY
jgi:hypothetical protein